MINAELKHVHIGRAIRERFETMNITKTEFGNLIGVPQQHINRLFERETIETKKLEKICEALDFNFFSLYCIFPTNVNAYLAAVALGSGAATATIGEAAVLATMEKQKGEIAKLEAEKALLSGQVEMLQNNLRDKDELIKVYRDK